MKVCQSQVVQGRAKASEGAPSSIGVLGRRADPEIQIASRPGQSVDSQGIGANQEILNLLV